LLGFNPDAVHLFAVKPSAATPIFLITATFILLLAACATRTNESKSAAAARDIKMKVTGESLVLPATQRGRLAFDQIIHGTLTLRSAYSPIQTNLTTYTEGADYTVDYQNGSIQRTPASRIPDYTTYPLYGLTNFDHSKYKDFSNQKYFVWADYQTTHGAPFAAPNPQPDCIAKIRHKLQAGGPFKIVSYGDSITAGGDASAPDLQFARRFAAYLQQKFPRAQIQIQDASIPGYTSRQALEWFDRKIAPIQNIDLVLIGFGMNDHNKLEVGGNDPAAFQTNLITLVRRIHESKSADTILFSAFPPNEKWRFGSHRMATYAEATRQAAEQTGSPYADVFAIWQKILQRKDQPSLLANNINHPNDFGHYLYLEAFEALQW
jgi:acyl-CoA thioesterase-1